jgi:hypothetical protein
MFPLKPPLKAEVSQIFPARENGCHGELLKWRKRLGTSPGSEQKPSSDVGTVARKKKYLINLFS